MFHSRLEVTFVVVAVGKKRLRTPSPPWSLPPREERRECIENQGEEVLARKGELCAVAQREDHSRLWREQHFVAASSSLDEWQGSVVGAENVEGDALMERLAREWELSRWTSTVSLATWNPLQYTSMICGRPVQVSLGSYMIHVWLACICFCFAALVLSVAHS